MSAIAGCFRATLDILRAIAEGKGPEPLDRGAWAMPAGGAGSSSRRCAARLVRHAGRRELLYDCDVDTRWAAAFPAPASTPRLLTAEFGTA